MATRSSSPRLMPLNAEQLTEVQRELLSGTQKLNIFLTLVRAPGLYRRWSPFAGKLLRGGKLAERDRELVILRVAWRWGSTYEWAQHVAIARDAGIDDEEIRRVAHDPTAAVWNDHERALLRAVDELHDEHCVSDPTWAALAERYTEEQLIEVLMLAGHYGLLAGVLNSLGVPLERDDLPALGEA